MVRAYHLILSAYGFWLPNDPRGSWSIEVRRYELLAFGPATKVSTRRSVAHTAHDADLRRRAKSALRHPPVRLDREQVRHVVDGFREATNERGYVIHACSVMPDHSHLVVARHVRLIEMIARHMKAKATQRLNAAGCGFSRSPWADGSWAVYLNTPRAIRAAIRYVELNPSRAGLPSQTWPLVTPYTG